jgi:serine/threonine protein phosphatase PrpC
MNYFVSYNTDVGLRKHTNQDSIAIKMMDTSHGRAVFAVVCDGMGGLAAGELASKEVIEAYCNWYDTELTAMVKQDAYDANIIIAQWRQLAISENERLGMYGIQQGASLGTTLSAILLYQNQYLIVHVGDSRIYEMTGQGIRQVTEDQSVVAREIALGNLTPEQALRDPRRSILLQCIGASPMVEPAFFQGTLRPETSYLVCSDGLCHEVSQQEMYSQLGPQACENPTVMRRNCISITELVKKRNEQDNISMILLKSYES